jgi:hypothetical protein
MDNLDASAGSADHLRLQTLSERVSFKNLTFEERLPLVWGWWWRQMLVGVLATIVALVPFVAIGIIVGIVAGLKGGDAQQAVQSVTSQLQIAGFIVGAVAGFLSFFSIIRWLTTVRIGSFELHIIRIAQASAPAAGLEKPESELVCEACGSPVSLGQEFCPGCSEKLEFDEKG